MEVFKARLENLLQITMKSSIRTKFRINSYFSVTLFRNTSVKTSEDSESFLYKSSLPKLYYEDAKICEGNLTELEFFYF